MKRSSSYSSDSGSDGGGDVEAGPASRRPSPSRRRLQGQVVLALASACVYGAGCANGVWLRRPSLLIEVKSRWFSPWGTIFGHVGAQYKAIHADRLERTDRRGFLHLRTRYWRDGRFRLSEAGIRSIVAAIEAHRNPAAAWPLWFGVAVLAAGALAALSFIRRSEQSHSHLK